MLDLGPAHRLGDSAWAAEGGGDLTLQMADRAQGHESDEDHLGDLLDGQLAQVAAAGQKGRETDRRGLMLEARTSAGMAAWVTSPQQGQVRAWLWYSVICTGRGGNSAT